MRWSASALDVHFAPKSSTTNAIFVSLCECLHNPGAWRHLKHPDFANRLDGNLLANLPA